jgi:hypothetical protein
VRQSTKRIEVVAKRLRNLPTAAKKPGQTPKKAVKTVREELMALLARGYTVEEIGRVLRGEGIEISAVTLRGYARTAAVAKRTASTDSGSVAPAKRKVATKRKASSGRTATAAGAPAPPAAAAAARKKSTPPSASAKARKPAAKPPAATTGSFHDYGQLSKATFVVRPDTPDSDL